MWSHYLSHRKISTLFTMMMMLMKALAVRDWLLRRRKEPVIDSSASSTDALFASTTYSPPTTTDLQCCTTAIETFYASGIYWKIVVKVVRLLKPLESVLGEEGRKDLDEKGWGEGESRQGKSRQSKRRQSKREARRTGTEKGRWSRSVSPMLDIVSLSSCTLFTLLRHWVGSVTQQSFDTSKASRLAN